jgi:hypothetical protein
MFHAFTECTLLLRLKLITKMKEIENMKYIVNSKMLQDIRTKPIVFNTFACVLSSTHGLH